MDLQFLRDAEPNTLTIGQTLGPTGHFTDQQEADEYYEALLDYLCRCDPEGNREYFAAILKNNIGYYAGYFDHETRLRVERLFHCEHPVFGAVTNGAPSIAEAFVKVVDIGREALGKYEH